MADCRSRVVDLMHKHLHYSELDSGEMEERSQEEVAGRKENSQVARMEVHIHTEWLAVQGECHLS